MKRADEIPLPEFHGRSLEAWGALWAVTAAFGSYFCMYGFRKPFTASGYTDTHYWGMGFKTILVTAQVFGYMVSKFIGIRLVAELPPPKRAITMFWLILIAEGSLIMFAILPRPWNAACLFFNGLSLGMVFGLVIGFLEGRKLTELLSAGLCASFILADGVTKSVGTWLLSSGITEAWMPSIAGLLYLLPFCVCTAMLAAIPPPSEVDVKSRSARVKMSHQDRRIFLWRYAPGLIPLLLIYFAVTIVRSIRADFAPEIWRSLGSQAAPSLFTQSEMYVALAILAVSGASVLIKDNHRAFEISLVTCGFGFCILTLALVAQAQGLISSFWFMVLLGMGLYIPYVVMHTTVFERMLCITRERGNLGFLVTLADSFGYLGYVAVMLSRNIYMASNEQQMYSLLVLACWLTIGLSFISLILAWRYFSQANPGLTLKERGDALA